MTPQATIRIRFHKQWQAYYAGDVAGFDATVAAGIVRRGVATYVVEPVEINAKDLEAAPVPEPLTPAEPTVVFDAPSNDPIESPVVDSPVPTPRRKGRPRRSTP